jgi:hypothetical protein
MPAPKLDYARKEGRSMPVGLIVVGSLVLAFLLFWLAGIIYLNRYGS